MAALLLLLLGFTEKPASEKEQEDNLLTLPVSVSDGFCERQHCCAIFLPFYEHLNLVEVWMSHTLIADVLLGPWNCGNLFTFSFRSWTWF